MQIRSALRTTADQRVKTYCFTYQMDMTFAPFVFTQYNFAVELAILVSGCYSHACLVYINSRYVSMLYSVFSFLATRKT